MTKPIAFIVGLVLLVALLLFSMTYTVSFHEVAIKTRFGREQTVVADAGLHFKLPLIADKITKIDTRLQLRESPMETIQTADGQQLIVQAFMMWKVREADNGPLDFYASYPAGVEEANQSLTSQFGTALRVGLSRYSFDDLIGARSRLQDAEAAIKAELDSMSAKGIEPVSVGVSKLMLPTKTTQAVLTRMQAARRQISEIERDRGNAKATAIESQARADADKIRTFADQRAAEIRSAGKKNEAEYMAKMDQEKSLAIFLAWKDALQTTLSQNTTLVIPTAFAPFHILQLNTPTDGQGFPKPTAGDLPIAAPSPSAKANESPSRSAPADAASGSNQVNGKAP